MSWEGVRNFQARNFMKQMKVSDLLLFYHSSGGPKEPTGIYGVAKVLAEAHVDESALDLKDEHFDPKAVKYVKEGKDPLWMCVDVGFMEKLKRPVTLVDIKADTLLRKMLVAKPGQRLSVLPVKKEEFERVVELSKV